MDIEEIFSKEKIGEAELILDSSGIFFGIEDFLRKSAISGAALFLIALSALLYFKVDALYITIIPFSAFFIPFAAYYIFAYYIFDSRRKKIEKCIPDLLLHAASFPKGTSISTIIKKLGMGDYEELSQEFRKAHSEILKGAAPEKAFSNMKQRNKSKVLERAIDLIIDGMGSGANASLVFRDAAEDIMETNSIIRERSASLVVQKYTLLIAGALIVPMVLGLVTKTVTGLDFGTLAELELGMPVAERAALLEAATFAGQVYIAEYVIIASVFVAFFESDLKKAVIYAAVLLPLSIISFNVVQII